MTIDYPPSFPPEHGDETDIIYSYAEDMEQRRKHRERISWLLRAFPVLPVIQVIVNLVLVGLDTLTILKLSPGASYYVSTTTVASLALIGFFVKGLFAESPTSSEPKR